MYYRNKYKEKEESKFQEGKLAKVKKMKAN